MKNGQAFLFWHDSSVCFSTVYIVSHLINLITYLLERVSVDIKGRMNYNL